MSRIRSIHPGLWTDDAFMALSAHARLLVIGLWNEAFDDGVFEWKPLTIKARVFPADSVDVPGLLDELVAGDFIRKEEFDGKPIGLIRNFREFQRPKTPNSSKMMLAEWRSYVGLSEAITEPLPNEFPNVSEKVPQMEDGGGRVEGEDRPPAPVSNAVGARDLFDEVWDAFPQNPTSVEAQARKQFDRLKAKDQVKLLDAAQRYRRWFVADNKRRDRTDEAGLSYVPHLANWIASGAWREADSLPIAGETGPPIPMTKLDRERDGALWLACEAVMGKKAPTSGTEWWFKDEIIAEARKQHAA